MRRRMFTTVSVLLAACGLLAACSTFSGAPEAPLDGGAPDAGANEGSVGVEGGSGEAGGDCAGCEVVGGDLHGKLVDWDPSGLDTGEDAVFFSGRNATRALLWKISLDKGVAAPAVVMYDGRDIAQVSIGGTKLFFAAEISTNDLLCALDKGATPPTPPMSALAGQGITWVGVAADEVVAAGATQVSICSLSLGACRAPVTSATIVRAAAGGDDLCFIGTSGPNTGLHCGQVPMGSPAPAFKTAETSPSIPAMVVRYSRAYWATPSFVRWEPLGTASGQKLPIAGVTALALDEGNLLYAVGTDLYRCERDTCTSPARLAKAPGVISFISPEAKQNKIYFLYGKGSSSQIARIPR